MPQVKKDAENKNQSNVADSELDKKSKILADSVYQQSLFYVMVMDMTWQLAVVVLLPIVGGFYLDRYFHTAPGLLIAGIVLAAFGVVSVMIRIVGKANRRTRGKK